MKVLGTTDERDRCDCCGTHIKLGVVLEEEPGLEPVVFGRYCAAKSLGWTGARNDAERRVWTEALAAERNAARAVRLKEISALLDAGLLVVIGQSWVPADLAEETRNGSTRWFNARSARWPHLFGHSGLL